MISYFLRQRAVIDIRIVFLLQFNKELDEQNTKIERVGKQNAKYSRELRSAKKSKGETPEEVIFKRFHHTLPVPFL